MIPIVTRLRYMHCFRNVWRDGALHDFGNGLRAHNRIYRGRVVSCCKGQLGQKVHVKRAGANRKLRKKVQWIFPGVITRGKRLGAYIGRVPGRYRRVV